MEIDIIPMDCKMEGVQDEYAVQSLSRCSSNIGDIFGDPQVSACLGDEYQARIPTLIPESDRLQLIHAPRNCSNIALVNQKTSLGLPIPVMWANADDGNIIRAMEFENSEMSHVMVQRGFCLLPGLPGSPWTHKERDSFLLGLYIFGKNLITVKRFMEGKKMEDILSFYYGKFYGSEEYQRWSDYRRRHAHGKYIFSRRRQRELLSRLFSHVSQECRIMLQEVSRKFREGKFSFEEYVFTLKDAVGINTLTEAASIGTEKQGLTSICTEPLKPKHLTSLHAKKTCSSLTSADIIKYLTGDFRLSKARSSDLFWEAVWPRLLAKGWHSEQPKDHASSGSINSWVFLVPGIRKFSRRLVKGNHYFDSVSDILNKVASDPTLVEIEVAEDSEHKKECGWNPILRQELDGLSSKKHHCYLQQRHSSCNQVIEKFTVVDTSLAYVAVAERAEVWELRSLPVNTSGFSSLSSKPEDDTSEDLEERHDASTAVKVTVERACGDSTDCKKGLPGGGTNSSFNPTISSVENHEIPYTNLDNNQLQRMYMKYQLMRKSKSGCSTEQPCEFPLMKQRSFAAHDNGELSCSPEVKSTPTKQTEDELQCTSHSRLLENTVSKAVPPPHLSLSANSLAKDSPDQSNEDIVDENCLHPDISPEKPLAPYLIDLNIPWPEAFAADETTMIVDMEPGNTNSFVNTQTLISETSQLPSTQPDSGAHSGKQASVNSRRQSTRNRPLTIKALEALELDSLNRKRRKSCKTSKSVRVSVQEQLLKK